LVERVDPSEAVSGLPMDSMPISAHGFAFAALDLGTNNCRLMIATPAGRSFRVLDSFSRIVRLGEGLQQSGALSEAAMDRTLGALHTCASRLGRRQLHGLRAVATEACRRASNGRSFLGRVKDETGLAIDVISSREEAELALESCAALLHSHHKGQAAPHSRGLLFDIGGGSTEVAWIRLSDGITGKEGRRGHELIGYHSLPLGVITLAESFGADMFEPGGYEAMVTHVTAHLYEFEQVHCIGREVRRNLVRLLGTSGTVTTLASVAMNLPRYRRALVDGVSLSREAAQDAIIQLRRAGKRGLVMHRCVGPDRAAYVLPGCAIFEAIHRLWPTELVTVADRGLRDGMLLRMMREAGSRGGRRTVTGGGARVPLHGLSDPSGLHNGSQHEGCSA
jgi:exopolyphosphatase / guanosine-5'-triphosphate,3'-diphosphate pyrophosphatase